MSLSARRGCVSEGVTTVLVVRTSPDVLWAPVTVPAEVVSPEVAVVGYTENIIADIKPNSVAKSLEFFCFQVHVLKSAL